MYDMIIFRGNNSKIDEFKVRAWLNSFNGEIIDFKSNVFGDAIFLYEDVRRV